MGQTWEHLLFAHWAVEPDALRAVVPPELPVDTFDCRAWLGIVPFEIRALRARGTPVGLRFPELNVRTYTTIDGCPGIYFFSLDASSRVAVAAARRTYHLPYFHARMAIARDNAAVRYRSRRPGRRWHAEYRPTGPAFTAAPGTLEHFLVERYRLYTVHPRRGVLFADIHHPPWSLHPAGARIMENTMAPIALPGVEPLLHFSARQDVVVWPPRAAA
jgi:uncharacterized protein YqjF (DUF2071 family)